MGSQLSVTGYSTANGAYIYTPPTAAEIARTLAIHAGYASFDEAAAAGCRIITVERSAILVGPEGCTLPINGGSGSISIRPPHGGAGPSS